MSNADTFNKAAEEKAYKDQIDKLSDDEYLDFLDEMYKNVQIPSLRAALASMIQRLTS